MSLLDQTVLALLLRRPQHGFALAKEFTPGTRIGDVYTVHRPAVYRSLRSLQDAGLVADLSLEPSIAGPSRVVKQLTEQGRVEARAQLNQPVRHMREVRPGLIVKLALRDHLGLESADFLRQQYEILQPLYRALHENDPTLMEPGFERIWTAWRWEHSDAVMRFLHRLLADASLVAPGSIPAGDRPTAR